MAITAGISLVASAVQTRKQAKAQRKSSKAAQRSADIQASRERREAIRQARVRRADLLTQSANTGAAGSSSEAGAIGALQGQLGSNIGTSFQTQALSAEQSSANRASVKAGTQASMFGTVGSFATGFIKPKTS